MVEAFIFDLVVRLVLFALVERAPLLDRIVPRVERRLEPMLPDDEPLVLPEPIEPLVLPLVVPIEPLVVPLVLEPLVVPIEPLVLPLVVPIEPLVVPLVLEPLVVPIEPLVLPLVVPLVLVPLVLPLVVVPLVVPLVVWANEAVPRPKVSSAAERKILVVFMMKIGL